jgi:hypothetical protein
MRLQSLTRITLAVCALGGCSRREASLRPTPVPVTHAATTETHAGTDAETSSSDAATVATSPDDSARVNAFLREHSLATPADYALVDGDRDGRTDVVYFSGIALQTTSGWVELAPTHESTPLRFSPPTASARGTLVGWGATGHETDQVAGRTVSYTWMNWLVYRVEGRALREVFGDRFDENSPFGLVENLRFEALSDGTVLEVAGPESRVLAWRGDTLVPIGCWSRTRPTTRPGVIDGCSGRSNAGLHFRAVDAVERQHEFGDIAPRTALRILSAGATRRGAARLYCVENGSDAPGWVFFTPAELTGCPSFSQ